MRKVTKILLKALSVTVLFLIFCPIMLTLLVSLPSVQNFVVDRAVKYLSRKLETTVSIDRIRLGAWGSIRVDGFYVEDYQKIRCCMWVVCSSTWRACATTARASFCVTAR